VNKKQKAAAPSLEDEEAFPDFGGAGSTAAAAAPNFMAAWSSSKAPVSMPEVVSRPKRAAQPAADQGAHSVPAVAQMGASAPAVAAAPAETGAGVPWRDSDWNRAAAKENMPSWSSVSNTTASAIESARKAAGKRVDPFAGHVAACSTVPKKKPVAPKTEAFAPAAQPSSSSTAAAAEPAPEKKKKEPKKKSTADSEGFTEVAPKKPDKGKKQEEEKKGGKKVGGASAFASLSTGGDETEKENKAPAGKNRKQQKKEKQEEKEKEHDVVVNTNTAPNKKKKKQQQEKKKVDEVDEFAVEAKDSKKGSKKGGKKGKKDVQVEESSLPMGVIGAALAMVAGLGLYFSMK